MNTPAHVCVTSRLLLFVTCLVFLTALNTTQARTQKKRPWVPVVMEKATVRGKIVILEDRRQERRVLDSMKVQLWSIADQGKDDRTNREIERGKLLHETMTDDLGMFTLPLLDEGQYILTIAELRLLLQVIPASQDRSGQQEPKILLIMVPKELVTQHAS